MTASCLMVCLDSPERRLPDTDPVYVSKGRAVETLDIVLNRLAGWSCVLFAMSANPLPTNHATRVVERLAGSKRLAVGLEGCIYPELFDGLASSVWYPASTSVPAKGLRVNELALHGLAIGKPPAVLLCRIADLYDSAAPAELPHLATMVARELYLEGWSSLLLPGGSAPRQGPSNTPPRVVRAILEFGGLRRLMVIRE